MGGTLGYVAIIIGLGAIFGGILEHTGATQILSRFLLDKFGPEKAQIALALSGFLIAIPVFFDVAFIILIPVLYALQKQTGKSLLYYAIPLLASLAVTHAFIPPTPGPIAVADIIGADLGWIILFGFVVGLPTTLIAGIVYGSFISKKIFITIPELGKHLVGHPSVCWTPNYCAHSQYFNGDLFIRYEIRCDPRAVARSQYESPSTRRYYHSHHRSRWGF